MWYCKRARENNGKLKVEDLEKRKVVEESRRREKVQMAWSNILQQEKTITGGLAVDKTPDTIIISRSCILKLEDWRLKMFSESITPFCTQMQ